MLKWYKLYLHTTSSTVHVSVFKCALTKCLSIDRALVEAHDVLSKSSSFITEDVFNLMKQKTDIFLLFYVTLVSLLLKDRIKKS